MITASPKIPAWIQAEIQHLATLTASHNIAKLRERRERPQGFNLDIYHHSEGTDSYFCDIRKRYVTWKQITTEADQKIACGQYLYTAVIEYKEGIHFVSGLTQSKIKSN